MKAKANRRSMVGTACRLLIEWSLLPGLLMAGVVGGCLWLSEVDRYWDSLDAAAAAKTVTTSVRRIDFADAGETLWVTRIPGHVQKLELATGRILDSYDISCETSPGAFITPNGSHLVFCTPDRGPVVRRLQPDPGADSPLPTGAITLSRVDLGPHGRAVTLTDDVLELWDLDRPDRPLVRTVHVHPPLGLAWSPDGRRVVLMYGDGQMVLCDGDTLAKLSTVQTSVTDAIQVTWSADGRRVALMAMRGGQAVWEPDTPGSLHQFNVGFCSAISLSPTGTELVTSDENGNVWLVPVDAPDKRERLGRASSMVNALRHAPDGERLIVGGIDGSVQCWLLAERDVLWRSTAPEARPSRSTPTVLPDAASPFTPIRG